MHKTRTSSQTWLLRLLVGAGIAVATFVLARWAMEFGLGAVDAISFEAAVLIVALLAAFAAVAAMVAFYAGVDDAAGRIYRETQIDSLTGLPSRAAVAGMIAGSLEEAERTARVEYLVDIDIDRFKQINEAIGYAQGDQLIRAFATRLQQALPQPARICRLGAGQFGILIAATAIEPPLSEFLERLLAKLMEPYLLSNHSQSVNLSCGVVVLPRDGTEPAKLLRRSSLALQSARAGGPGSWAIFRPEMSRVADHRQWVESELSSAIDRGDFVLHYQPQLDLMSGKTVGYEALIRWVHPERGVIPPNDFIPIAEETGMICQIGDWVLKQACRDAVRLPDDCFVAVNISPAQFMTPDFVGQVRRAIEQAGIPTSRLELELTETAMMQDRERAAAILAELAAMDISVAVDDFGTGYSNLSYLIDFSFRKLKIDRSFVSRMEADPSSGAVISTIVGLSRALGVHTIAEGVENANQATLLRAAGCNVVQGFFFGRPAPLSLADTDTANDKAEGEPVRRAAVV